MKTREKNLRRLGLTKTAGISTIRNAYRALVKKWHPDKHTGRNKEIAEEKTKELNEAFSELTKSVEQPSLENATPVSRHQHFRNWTIFRKERRKKKKPPPFARLLSLIWKR